MTKLYLPFDAGAGANTMESGWALMAKRWLGTGVIRDYLNQLEVFADSSGMQVKVKSGGCWIEGYYYEDDAQETVAVTTADLVDPRIDRVIVRLDRGANTIDVVILTGTHAVTPVPPTLTQTVGGIWEESLAQVRVDAGVLVIAAAKVTDERGFAGATQLADQAVYQAWALS